MIDEDLSKSDENTRKDMLEEFKLKDGEFYDKFMEWERNEK